MVLGLVSVPVGSHGWAVAVGPRERGIGHLSIRDNMRLESIFVMLDHL